MDERDVAAGSTILIPRDETMDDDIAASSLDARFTLVPEASNLRKVTYRVLRGDTLHSVARRYRVNEKDVIVWNNLTSPSLFAGQRLELTVPVAATRSAKRGKKQAAAQPATQKSAPAKTAAKTPARTGSNSKVVAVAR